MKISVRQRNGDVEVLDCDSGAILMRILAERGLVEATCGGECSCATCQVYVEPGYLPKLATQGEMERELLEGMTNTRPESRLACQIVLSAELDGMVIEIAPRADY